MAFVPLNNREVPRGPALYLPSSYARERDAAHRRPLIYREPDPEWRGVIIANAVGVEQRIPLDELKDMAEHVRQSRIAKGDLQKREEYADRMREGWGELIQWLHDRRNGRVSVGAATFAKGR